MNISLLTKSMGLIIVLLGTVPAVPCDIVIHREPEEWPSTYKISQIEGMVVGKFRDPEDQKRHTRAIADVKVVLKTRVDERYSTTCGAEVTQTLSDKDGRFTIADARPGKYCLVFDSRKASMSASFFVDVVKSEQKTTLLANISPEIQLPECVVDESSPSLQITRSDP